MKNIFLIVILFSCSLFAQEKSQTQSIELPDFVITGKESINIPKMQKSLPEFIPLLSKDFFTPSFPNDEEILIEVPKLENEIVSIGNYSQNTNALIKFSAGLQTWPKGEFYYNDWIDNFSYKTHLFGLNELEYKKKAGLNIAGISLGSSYFIDHESEFLPGLEINFDGNYLYESYNFFGSINPSLDRITNSGIADLSFNYVTNPSSKFGIDFNDLYYEQKDDAVNENIFGIHAYVQFKLVELDLRLEGNFKNQTISGENFATGNQYYFNSIVTLGFKLFNILSLKGGVYIAESEGNTFFAPIGFGTFKLNKNISFFGEFAPNTEFLTLYDFKENNRYYRFNNFVNLFTENKFKVKAGVKYEYERYFEINGGVGYLMADNSFYFDDNMVDGFFTIHNEDIENSFAFLNLLFRKGPFGEFYADVKLQNITGSNNKTLPYSSTILSKLNYGYNWSLGFGLKLGLNYFSEAYSDYDNNAKIPSKIDLTASFYYELFKNFKLTLGLENILNEKYYYFRNYKAKPIDILVGAEFRW